jgi:hypothetical protein
MSLGAWVNFTDTGNFKEKTLNAKQKLISNWILKTFGIWIRIDSEPREAFKIPNITNSKNNCIAYCLWTKESYLILKY